MSSMLTDAFAHHAWATERVIEACAALNDEQLTTNAIGTRGPIIETLQHLVHSDHWYLSFFAQRPELADDQVNAMSVGELRSLFVANAARWLAVVADERDPDREIVEHDEGWTLHSPVGVRLAQVVHHGTDHRSQICTALTSLGIEPPDIDLWAFARATGRERADPPSA
jgi:uncharacterized damage-inducible protein DinB